jgi:hypothetical protein
LANAASHEITGTHNKFNQDIKHNDSVLRDIKQSRETLDIKRKFSVSLHTLREENMEGGFLGVSEKLSVL